VEPGSLGGSGGGELVMQQLPSSGQWASESTSSQNKANKPLTQSPLQGRSGCGDVGTGLGVVEYGHGVTVVSNGTVEPLAAPEQNNHITNFTINITSDFNYLCWDSHKKSLRHPHNCEIGVWNG
jgi:hypothetical protein